MRPCLIRLGLPIDKSAPRVSAGTARKIGVEDCHFPPPPVPVRASLSLLHKLIFRQFLTDYRTPATLSNKSFRIFREPLSLLQCSTASIPMSARNHASAQVRSGGQKADHYKPRTDT
jgi:hypothetical protein